MEKRFRKNEDFKISLRKKYDPEKDAFLLTMQVIAEGEKFTEKKVFLCYNVDEDTNVSGVLESICTMTRDLKNKFIELAKHAGPKDWPRCKKKGSTNA